ncbi:serine/threonine-protein kinase, partial [Candidatus Protofrankia datiscae]
MPPGPAIEGYRDFRRVAIGGFSTVYTAYQERFARTVAVKVLSADVGDAAALRRFTRECQASGRLSHLPEIITVYDAGATTDDQPFIAMQYFPRGSLVDRMRDNNQPNQPNRLSAPETVGVGVSVARALAAAHRADITHRDIKPGNLLVSDEGGAVLSDFGVASFGVASFGVAGIGAAGIAAGPEKSVSLEAYTPAHCAPEVLDGQRYSPAADVYAFGSTLYTLLAGTAPFAPRAGDGPATVMRRILAGDAAELDQAVPEPLRALIGHMMSVDPRQRPSVASLVEKFDALRDALGAEPVARLGAAGDDLAAVPPSSDEPKAHDPKTGTGSGAAAADVSRLEATRRRSRVVSAGNSPRPTPAGTDSADGAGSPSAAPGPREPLDTPTRLRPRGVPPLSGDRNSARRRRRNVWTAAAAAVATILVIVGTLTVTLRGKSGPAEVRADNLPIPSGAAPSAPDGTGPSDHQTLIIATTIPTQAGFGPEPVTGPAAGPAAGPVAGPTAGPVEAVPANPDSARQPTSPAVPTAPAPREPTNPPPRTGSGPAPP